MALIYKGKVTFSDIMPGLNDAAATLQEKNAEVESFLSDRQKNVAGLSTRVTSIQDELARAQSVATDAQQILGDATAILEEAKGLVNEVAEALTASGIYHYNYVGTIGAMDSDISSEFSNGLPDKTNSPNEVVAAVLLIAGGDGGTAETLSRITALAGQIGGNATDIVEAYSVAAGT